MRQDCGGNLMFNMYLSGSSFSPVKNDRNSYNSWNCAGCRVLVRRCSVSRAEHCSAFSIWKPVCSFVGNRKSFFLDAFPGFSEKRPQRRHASCIRLRLDEDTIRLLISFEFCSDLAFFFFKQKTKLNFILFWIAPVWLILHHLSTAVLLCLNVNFIKLIQLVACQCEANVVLLVRRYDSHF